MKTILTVSLPHLFTITRADWGAVFHRWAKALAPVLVVPYVAGLMAGDAWHRFTAWVEHHHLTGLARLGLPGGNYPETPDSSTDAPAAVVADAFAFMEEYDDVLTSLARTQRLAPATLATIAAPPLESLTVAQLRQMARAAGHRKLARSGRRAVLLEALAA